MPHLHYLTVQDMLWINLQVTKKVQHFNYAKLEEATFYQYAYGSSSSLVPQAGRFLHGFLKLHPFDTGNESTALMGCSSFLAINGMRLNVEDGQAVDWLDKVMTKQVSGPDAVAAAASKDSNFHETLKSDVRTSIKLAIDAYPATIAALADRSATAK